MSIRLRAERTDSGVLLTGIASQADAERLCDFFRERGTAATIPPLSFPVNLRVFLVAISMEQFAESIRGTNIELMP